MKQIAIIGAGFAGLAAAWHYLNQNFEVTIYDRAGIGGGASGVAPGLLHTYHGKQARLAKDGGEALAAAKKLLDIASEALDEPVYQAKGLLRIPINKEQEAHFDQLVKTQGDVVWINEPWRAIHITSGIAVDTQKYLKGLALACEKKGAVFVQEEVEADLTLVATGAACQEIPLERLKGQILELEWPVHLQQPPCPIVSPKYVVMRGNTCLVGSTYERNYASPEPDIEVAKEQILPPLTKLYPDLANAKILSCRAGIRAHRPGYHFPVIEQIDAHKWVYVGLGSKGLLYSAYYCRHLPL